MEMNEDNCTNLNCPVNAALVTIGNARFSASAALKELHNVATQNLITSTQECIARQLSTYCDERIIEDNQNDNNLSDHKEREDCLDDADDEQCYVALKEKDSTKKCQKSLICKHNGCGRKFTWPAHYKYHQLTHTDDRPHACKVDGCYRNFFTAQRLAVHMRIHTGERPFSCTEEGCNKSFTTAGNLRNHTRIHTGERPFMCSEEGCDKSFTESSSLKKHMFVHSGKKPFICELCGKAFSQCGSKNVHKRRYHNFINPVENRIEEISKESGLSLSESPLTDPPNAENLIVMNYNPEDNINSIFETKDTSTTAVLAETTNDVILFTSNQEIVAITTNNFSPLRELTDMPSQSRILL